MSAFGFLPRVQLPRVQPFGARLSGRFVRDEDGAATVWGITWFMLFAGLAGLTIDTTDGFRSKAILQVTADAAALAAIQDLSTPSTARETALTYAGYNMSSERYGTVLDGGDVVIGDWDPDTKSITPDEDTPDAIMVVAREDTSNGNALGVSFLKLFGLQFWNVRAATVAQRFVPPCINEGLVATNLLDLASNNVFVDNICIYGGNGVDMQSNNTFESGTTVAMQDLNDVSYNSGNTGLEDALTEDRLDTRMTQYLDDLYTDLLDPANSEFLPDYIDSSLPVISVSRIQTFDWDTIQTGRVYYFACQSDAVTLTVPASLELHDVVVIADCNISIGANAYIHDAIVGSRASQNVATAVNPDRVRDAASVSSADGVQYGVPDDCAPGGGAQIYSNGSIHTSASTLIDGSQFVAAWDIYLGARDGGVNGISAQAGNNIYVTSENSFGSCQKNVDTVQSVWYYRVVM